MKRVGLFWPEAGDDIPNIDWDASQLDWEKMRIAIWLYPSGSVDPTISRQIAVVNHPLALDWDFYSGAGIWGIFSARLRDAIAPYCSTCFDFWPIELNGAEYYGVRRVGTIDCLDRIASGKYKNGSTLYYDPCVFRDEGIPDMSLFSIPEVTSIFVTADLARLLLPMQFKGVCIFNAGGSQRTGEDLDWNPSW